MTLLIISWNNTKNTNWIHCKSYTSISSVKRNNRTVITHVLNKHESCIKRGICRFVYVNIVYCPLSVDASKLIWKVINIFFGNVYYVVWKKYSFVAVHMFNGLYTILQLLCIIIMRIVYYLLNKITFYIHQKSIKP